MEFVEEEREERKENTKVEVDMGKDHRESKARKGRRMRKKVKKGEKLEEGSKENREGERMLVENVMSWMEERRKEGGESGQGS